ncbi:helix-turn-helix domain-containing protein [Mucilaginibacter ginkgonis]|uniref:Helix-turn-helix transcriptional regulator n=1 Tax=Mucilaginibacter ginkgonis TaxID=2682091 RepID=A0A6I4IPB0_9SPHI|nr:helix-turn-helix transcriptional regulator [Mucilaginibacter ginkgonis]QQL50673.1 helix-turn-helix transcriptional regulator [Mucilaginibacter ginkgonis]
MSTPKENTNKAIGKNIRVLRRNRNWSQDDVASRLGISVPAFSKIETGVTDINLSRLEQIAQIFEVGVPHLITLQEERAEPQLIQLNFVQKRLQDRESEIAKLRRKVIELYEEVYIIPAMAV